MRIVPAHIFKNTTQNSPKTRRFKQKVFFFWSLTPAVHTSSPVYPTTRHHPNLLDRLCDPSQNPSQIYTSPGMKFQNKCELGDNTVIRQANLFSLVDPPLALPRFLETFAP